MHEDVLSPEERANLRTAHKGLVEFFRFLATGEMLEASRAYGRVNQLLMSVIRSHTELWIDGSEPDPNHKPLPPGNAVSRLIRCLGGSWAWFELRMIVVERNELDWNKKAGRLAHASNRLYQSEMRTDHNFEPNRWKLFDACGRFEKGVASSDDDFWQGLQELTARAVEQIADWCKKQLRDGTDPDDAHWNDCFRQIIEICQAPAAPSQGYYTAGERSIVRTAHEGVVRFFRLMAENRLAEAVEQHESAIEPLRIIWRSKKHLRNPKVAAGCLCGDFSLVPAPDRTMPLQRCLMIGWAWTELLSVSVGDGWGGQSESGRIDHARVRLLQFRAEPPASLVDDLYHLAENRHLIMLGRATFESTGFHPMLQAVTLQAVMLIADWCAKQLRDGTDPDDAHWNDCFRQIIEICRTTTSS